MFPEAPFIGPGEFSPAKGPWQMTNSSTKTGIQTNNPVAQMES